MADDYDELDYDYAAQLTEERIERLEAERDAARRAARAWKTIAKGCWRYWCGYLGCKMDLRMLRGVAEAARNE